MVKVFLLDDELIRRDIIRGMLLYRYGPKTEIIEASNYETSIKLLEQEKSFDLIMLDHDIGTNYCPAVQAYENGKYVAQYIVEKKIAYKHCIIHSLNSVGAERIFLTLNDAKEPGNIKVIPVSFLNIHSFPDI
jgi:hypothetical protein